MSKPEQNRNLETLENAELHLQSALRELEEGWWKPTPDQLAELESLLTNIVLKVEALQQQARNLGR